MTIHEFLSQSWRTVVVLDMPLDNTFFYREVFTNAKPPTIGSTVVLNTAQIIWIEALPDTTGFLLRCTDHTTWAIQCTG